MNIHTLKRVMKYIKPYMPQFIILLIFSVSGAILTLYSPILVGNAIDLMIEKGKVDFISLRPILIKLAVLIPLIFASQYIMNRSANYVAFKTVSDIRKDLFSKLQRLPMSYIDRNSQGEILSRVINDSDMLSDGLILGFAQFFSGVSTIFATLIFMLSINIPISLIVILLTPLSLIAANFIARKSFSFFRTQSSDRGKMTSFINERINGLTALHLHRAGEEAIGEFEKLNSDLEKSSIKAVFFSSLTNPSTRFINGLVYASVGVFGGITAIGGGITIGLLSCFLTYANQYTKPFNEISGVFSELQASLASANRIFDILDEKEEENDKNLPSLSQNDGRIKISNLFFSYEEGRAILKDISVSINNGEKVAIVGKTGCGKTTLINLLMRFYNPDSGKIEVSNTDISAINRRSLRENIGMVLQDTWLKEGTVRENIAYGSPNSSDEDIISASKRAYADSFIRRLSGGYLAKVGEGGKNLSQGQRQLICIARVMNRMPPILILDEATSSIDLVTEIKVNKAIDELTSGCTSLVVAHRLQTIKNADKILFLDSGRIIESGNHEYLLKKGGEYAKLYNSQFENDDSLT